MRFDLFLFTGVIVSCLDSIVIGVARSYHSIEAVV